MVTGFTCRLGKCEQRNALIVQDSIVWRSSLDEAGCVGPRGAMCRMCRAYVSGLCVGPIGALSYFQQSISKFLFIRLFQ